MSTIEVAHSYLELFYENGFDLQQHLQHFLDIDPATLRGYLDTGNQDLMHLGNRDFDWSNVATFYGETVGTAYLFELAAWHLNSREYIGDTLKLVADNAHGRVLDFGGGIGTHTIGAALSPEVDEVVFWDLNPVHRAFVRLRAQQLGLAHKILVPSELPDSASFDSILCFDVLEHMADPAAQLLMFHEMLTAEGRLLVNWYFSKGLHNEYPFHLDDPQQVDAFFRTLQRHFLEVFHPYFITARCYRPV